MATASEGILYYEAGQDLTAFAALSDSGDHTVFNSGANLWSNKSGYTPKVYPNGLATGGATTPAASGTKDLVDVAGLTCYLAGVLTSVNAVADVACVRGTTKECSVNSITVTGAGAIAVLTGTQGDTIVETRGAAGGPPWIPTGSIEIKQVRFTAMATAVVTAAEIKSTPGTHTEKYNFPTWVIDRARVESGVLGYAGIDMNSALPLIHSDDAGTTTATKKVYVEFYEPDFAQVPESADFVPAETSHSVSSTQIYGGTKGSTSSSLGQGSFTAYFEDGVTDGLLSEKNSNIWFKFKPDRLKTPYILTQGIFGVSRTFPSGDSIQASCTISADTGAVEVSA